MARTLFMPLFVPLFMPSVWFLPRFEPVTWDWDSGVQPLENMHRSPREHCVGKSDAIGTQFVCDSSNKHAADTDTRARECVNRLPTKGMCQASG